MKSLILALLVLSATLHAEVWTGTSDVKFKGTSTLHDFAGTVPAVPLRVMVKTGQAGRIISASSNVEVARMTTAEKDRDENMWKMLNAARFRLIKITVPETPETTLRPAGGTPGSMPITLTIAGTSGLVTGHVTNLRETPNSVSFELGFPVSLMAFNLHPPSTLGGLIKVGDTVTVSVQVSLKLSKS